MPMLQGNQAEEVITTEPSSYEEPDAVDSIEEEEVIDEIEEEDEDEDLNPIQSAVVEYLTTKTSLDPMGALEWAETEECPISDAGYQRLGDAIKDSDPEVVRLGMGLLSIAKRSPEYFDFETEEVTENFSEEEQQALYDAVGGEHTSAIVNHTHKLITGEMTRFDILKEVAANPELRNAYFDAARKGLISFNL